MARYYFSIRVRDRLLPDREGVELPEDADPAQCAHYLAQKLRRDGAIGADLSGCSVEVNDAAGAPVARVPVPDTEEALR